MANDNFDLPRPADAVPNSTSAVINDNAKVLDYFVNSSGTVVTRTGKEILTLDEAIKTFGFGVAGFTFATGGTLTSLNLLVPNSPTDGYLYKYVGSGSAPITVTAGTNPNSGSNWQKFSATSHNSLSGRNEAGAHDASAIAMDDGSNAESSIVNSSNVANANNALLTNRIQKAGLFTSAGAICVLGDSLTVGEASTSLSKSYASIIFDSIADYLTGGYGIGNEVNFNWTSMGNVALTGQTAGTSGPIQRSQVIAVNGTITVARANATKMAFYFDRTPTSGSVEIRQNGSLLATIDCSGAAAKTVLSQYVNISSGGAPVQFKVINNPVEFLALVPIRDNPNQPNVLMPMRMAVSGWNTADFLTSPDQILSIGECGGIGGTSGIFVLAVGSNDIYTSALTPSDYIDNLRTIGATLESYRQSNVIVLVVPPRADETIFPPAIEDYDFDDYRNALYSLSKERQWPIIDHSVLRLKERSLLSDGLHPNDEGHLAMAENVMKSCGIEITKPLTSTQKNAIDAKSDAVLYRKRADLTTFTGTTTREKTLTSMGVTASDFITDIYIRWKSTGVMIPYKDCQDLQNGLGLQILRSFSGTEYSVAKIFYKSVSNDGTGFASPQGALSSSITNTVLGYNDAEVIVEFIRSSKIQL